MKPLVFSEKSLDDLKSILVYIAQDKPNAAMRFVEQLEHQCNALAAFPGVGTGRGDLAEHLRLFSFRGCGIYTFDQVRIERVLQASMDVKSQHFE
jgi:toxin ParE1/3/4